MDELIFKLNKYHNWDRLILKYDDGAVLSGYIDTIYETDNGLDEDEINFEEFDACAFRIDNVIKNSVREYRKSEYIEVSRFNAPYLIVDSNNKVVWNAKVKRAFLYQGNGDDVTEIDIADVVKEDNPVEENVNNIAKTFIKSDAQNVMSMCMEWKGHLYRYIWVNDERDESIKQNCIGLCGEFINDLNDGRRELHYMPGKVIMIKYDAGGDSCTSMDADDLVLLYRDIEESNHIKKKYAEKD